MSSLRQRLVERIRAEGPLTFAQYMEAALFDREAGFYTRGPGIGQGGHFATSAEAHPAFAEAITAEAHATWLELGEPADFRVTEAGPGTGGLARLVSEGLTALGVGHELVLIERSTGLTDRQRTTLKGLSVRWVEHPAALSPAPGFLYGNEILDALPVRLLQWPDEVLVDADATGRLIETLVPADPALAAPIVAAESTHGSTMTIQPDGSVLASGITPPDDQQILTLETDATDLRLVALNAMVDASLPHGRIGRAQNGNAILDSIEVEAISKIDQIDLFIHDSDHSAEHESREFKLLQSRLSAEGIVLSDNSHVKTELAKWSLEHGRRFVYFSEQPLNHWYPGAGIGVSMKGL